MAPRSLDLRRRLTVAGTRCPRCDEPLSEEQLSAGGAASCAACGADWAPVIQVTDPGGAPPGEHAYLARDDLLRGLAALAAERGGRIGERHLEEHAPALLANCIAHHGSYRAARRRLGRWLRDHPEAAPTATSPAVHAQAVDGDLWCPYCHDWFEPDERPYRCPCGAVFHPDCRLEAGRCTTLGCDARYEPPRPDDEGWLGRLLRRWRDPEVADAHTGLPTLVRVLMAVGFTLPLTAALLGALVHVVRAGDAFPGRGDDLVSLGMLLLWWLLTAGLAFGVQGARLDGRTRTIRPYLGLALPFHLATLRVWRQPRPVREGARVVLSRELWGRGKDGGGTWVYPVYADGVLVEHSVSHARARLAAERVAKLLGLGLSDQTAGTFRPAGALDQPWLAKDARVEEPGALPPSARLSVEPSDGARRYRIAPRGSGCLLVPVAVGALLIALLGGSLLVGPGPRVALWVLAAVCGLPALGVAAAGAFLQRIHESVEATPKQLRRTRHTWLGDWTTTIPAAELEELELCRPVPESDAQALAIRSDRRTVEVGEGLEPEALRWLLRSLAADLRGEPATDPPA